MVKKFDVSFYGDFVLSTDEIWPDGDAPQNPTPKDVIEAMKQSARFKAALLDDWNLEKDLHVQVYDGKSSEVW
jgi:hypothetical protein